MGIRGGKKAVMSVFLGDLNPRLQTDPLQETGAFPAAFGLHGQVLVAVGAAGVAFVRRHQKLPLYWTEPVPAGSKTDPPLPKTEPISNTCDPSVITYLRKSKKCFAAVRERSKKKVRETTVQTPRSVKKEREEVLQVPEQRFPCSPWRRTW